MGKTKKRQYNTHTDHDESVPPRAIDAIRARANMDLTNIVAEPMNFWQMNQQIYNTALTKSPEYMVILIEKDPKIKRYQASIYINKK